MNQKSNHCIGEDFFDLVQLTEELKAVHKKRNRDSFYKKTLEKISKSVLHSRKNSSNLKKELFKAFKLSTAVHLKISILNAINYFELTHKEKNSLYSIYQRIDDSLLKETIEGMLTARSYKPSESKYSFSRDNLIETSGDELTFAILQNKDYLSKFVLLKPNSKGQSEEFDIIPIFDIAYPLAELFLEKIKDSYSSFIKKDDWYSLSSKDIKDIKNKNILFNVKEETFKENIADKKWDVFLKTFNEKTTFHFAYLSLEEKTILFEKIMHYARYMSTHIYKYYKCQPSFLLNDFLSKNIKVTSFLREEVLNSSQFNEELSVNLDYFKQKFSLEKDYNTLLHDSVSLEEKLVEVGL